MQVFSNKESIGNLTKTGNTTVQLSPSVITIGAKQYISGNLDCDTSTSGVGGLDTGAAQNWKKYYVYAVVDSGNSVIIASLSDSNPLGYNKYVLVGDFKTDGSAQVGIGVGVAETGKVGDKKDSMLTEAQFQAENGSGWILCDGRSITGSQFHTITGNTPVPDARGVFIRGKDNSAGQNPDGDLALGAAQGDTFQGHGISWKGSAAPAGHPGGFVGGYTYDGFAASGFLTPLSGTGFTNNGNGTPRQSSETRAKNVTMNIFMKIN